MEVSRAVLVGVLITIAQFSFLVSVPDIWRGMDIRLRSPWSRVSDPGREKRFGVLCLSDGPELIHCCSPQRACFLFSWVWMGAVCSMSTAQLSLPLELAMERKLGLEERADWTEGQQRPPYRPEKVLRF